MEFLRLIRYKNLIIIVLLQYLLRYSFILPILHSYNIVPVLSGFRFGLMVLATVLLAASGYVINDYFDIQIDHINRPGKVIVGQRYSRRTALFLHIVFTISGVIIGLFLAYVARRESYAIMFLAIPVILWYYSTTFKKQVLIGNIIIAFLTALVAYLVVSLEFAMLAKIHGDEILTLPACSIAWFWTSAFAFFAFISTLGREIIKDMEDVEGDLLGGCKTLPIELGMGYSKTIVILLHFLLIVSLWFGLFQTDIATANELFTISLTSLLSIVLLVLIAVIYFAKAPKHYKLASSVSKLNMLLGILFFALAGYILFR